MPVFETLEEMDITLLAKTPASWSSSLLKTQLGHPFAKLQINNYASFSVFKISY
jgi:hypothetical protein